MRIMIQTFTPPYHPKRLALIWSPPCPSVGLYGISFGRRMIGIQIVLYGRPFT